MEKKENDLYYLHELSDYKVASDYADVRGWEVKDEQNRTIGKVDGLLVSKQAERVVYLDVQVDEDVIENGHNVYAATTDDGVQEFLNKDGEDHLIIPIGMADLDEDNDEVHCDKIGYDMFSNSKRFAKGTGIDRGYELVSYTHFAGDKAVTERIDPDNDFYNQDLFYNRTTKR